MDESACVESSPASRWGCMLGWCLGTGRGAHRLSMLVPNVGEDPGIYIMAYVFKVNVSSSPH